MPPIATVAPAAPIASTEAFRRLRHRNGLAWLDSSLARPGDGRFSILCAEPRWWFTATGARWQLRDHHREIESGSAGALEKLDALLEARRVAVPTPAAHLPFVGGAIGWVAYDLARSLEKLPALTTDDLAVPDVAFAWYDAALVWDHEAGTTWWVGVDSDRPADAAIGELQSLLAIPAPQSGPLVPSPTLTSDFTRAEYLAAVAEVREGIARGEFYQLNLVQRFSGPVSASPVDAYLRLRATNPAPFSAYLSHPDTQVLCSSPERFLEITPGGQIRTCPIKGTRPRGGSADSDAACRAELLGSDKERAELLMIVDLLRNDLGRVCVPGSVRVPRLHAVESFATVHHLVGEVIGQLAPRIGLPALLRAVFPGGSITGAPKISAMHAIERFERHRRGIAMGSLGYFSAHGRTDLAIAIRSIILHRGRAHVSVGAGIVWDSDPAAEYAETLLKGRALFDALGAPQPSP